MLGIGYFQRSPIDPRAIFSVAVVLATLFLLQAYMHHYVYADIKSMGEFDWLREAPVPYLNFLCWACLCPLVARVLQRWPLNTRPIGRNLLMHALLGLLIGAAHELITSSIYYAILWANSDFVWNAEYRSYAFQALFPATLQRFMEYWTLLCVLVAVQVMRQVREKETQLLRVRSELQESQLNALRQQLRPHFLFNTLNSVSSLVGRDPEGARRMLERLGHLLRVSLDRERQQKVRLDHEIGYVSSYLGIEAVRFRDRLQVHYNVPQELHAALVPAMILQPLAENVIKHGPDSSLSPVTVTVSAERRNGHVLLGITDDGRGCRDHTAVTEGGGIGIRNVRERLRTLYGDKAVFAVGPGPGKGFQVLLTIPYETSSETP
ncbi:MAG: histidine kinase [Flavobacteriales bacterium]